MTQRHYSSAMNHLVLIVGIGCLLYYLACGLFVRFGQSMLWTWAVVGLACVARYFLVRAGFLNRLPLPLIYTVRAALALFLSFFLAVEGVLVTNMVRTPPEGLDYLIVLGARVNPGRVPSLSLQTRVERAAEYLKDNPETIAILSGGQGEDEEVTEASCMLELMLALGISEERILIEDQSTSTAENIRFSYALIEDPAATVGVVTNGYHIYRAMLIARSHGDHPVSGLSAYSSRFLLPHNLAREFMTLVVGGMRGDFRLSKIFS